MLADLETLEAGTTLRAPICIVGAGAAGIAMALEFARAGIEAILLEGGGLEFSDMSQAIYEGRVKGEGHTDIAFSRLRQFGGTTGHWTGLCAPLAPIDFEKRKGVPHSGWPITRADLDPFYERAQPYLQLGPFAYRPADWNELLSGTAWPLDNSMVEPAVYQSSPPTRFAETYLQAIADAPTIRCLYHANLKNLELADGGAVTRAEVVSYSGKTILIEAERYVLACGGIENARLLLNFDSQRPHGIGNENDLVGRYFMDHMNCTLSELAPADPQGDLAYYLPHETDTVPVHIGLKLTEDLMRREGLLDNTVFLDPVWESESHNDDFRDHAWLAFSAMGRAFSRGQVPDQFWARTCTIAEAPGAVLTGVYRHIRRRFEPPGTVTTIRFRQDAEQAPNPDSRVTLNGELDQFGMRRATLDWQLTEADLLSLRRTHELIGQAVGAAGIGRVRLGLDIPPAFDAIYTGYHHIGTTRMHEDPRQGVVDADCRVHSVENLYIAGSSVFTTSGTANPTLTIVALAIRLADHLAGEISGRA